jgi:NAD(P)-dependent dehydrogenase (short-subunit alcohol dehydrogenase family)
VSTMNRNKEAEVVLITGATAGIGKSTAELLAKKGYRVFGTSRDPARKSVNGCDLLPLEVSSDESVAACLHAVAEKTGGPH